MKRLVWAALLLAPALGMTRGYTPQGRCGDFARLDIASPAGTCVALLADEAEGLRAPRRVLEVAPGRYWVIDMGSWEPRRGRLLEMTLPTDSPAPRRARFATLADNLDRPLGLVVGPDAKVYIGEAGSIWRTPVPQQPGGAPVREVLVDKLPADGTHPLKELAFAPNGRLYVNMGSDSDACRDSSKKYPTPCPDLAGPMPRAAVYEAIFDGPERKLQSFKPFATGLRNSVALTVLQGGPAKGTVLQGENSIDYDKVGQPPEELNRLQAGRDYGWPYCVGQRQPTRGYPQHDCKATEAPLMLWPAHAAPLQMQVGPAGSRFEGQLLVAWRGHQPPGHRVVGYRLDAKGLPSGKPIDWLAGWSPRAGVRPMGKPTGFTVDRQGRLLVVEDFNRTVLMLLPDGAAAPKK